MAKHENHNIIGRIFDLDRKVIDSQSLIPLTVLMHEYKTTTDKWHRHNGFYELSIVCGGSARNESEHGSFLIHPGDVLLFLPGSVHRYRSINNFRHYNILFTEDMLHAGPAAFDKLPRYTRFFTAVQDGCSELFSVPERELSLLAAMLENLKSEMFGRSQGSEEAMYADFIRVMVFLLRYSVPRSALPAEQNTFQIGRVIHYMERNTTAKLNLEQLAATAGMSISNFRHHFRALTGFSPIDYLVRLRLKRAVILLGIPSTPISTAAMQSGFADHNYFSRKFRQIFHCTPRAYREACMARQRDVQRDLELLG